MIGCSEHRFGDSISAQQPNSCSEKSKLKPHNDVYVNLVNAEQGIQMRLPLKMLPGDVNLGNVVTMTLQRNPIAEKKRHDEILSI